MEDQNLEQSIINDVAPTELKKYAEGDTPLSLEEVFPNREALQISIREKGVGKITGKDGNDVFIAADLDSQGRVVALAAAIKRAPTRADLYLQDSVPDLNKTKDLKRNKKIALFREIAKKEGIINNAIKKKASLVSQAGSFKVRAAKQGRRPREAVAEDLLTLLTFWQENVNTSDEMSAITGSRGLRQLIRRGARQAMVEGDVFLRTKWVKIKVPTLGNKSFNLPIVINAMPSDEIEVVPELLGIAELYNWIPDSKKISAITNAKDPVVKKVISETFSKEVLNDLKKKRKHTLDPRLLIHIKHGGVDTEPYGESDVEATLTDLAYARSLKALDFVTIDSLINRMLIIKIGDENPDSAFHNQATVQKRVNVFNNLISEVGPNMLVVWAGHDIDKLDVGAHDKLLETDGRHQIAQQSIKLSAGVPEAVLTGNAEGGNAVAWAGFISLAALAAELQEEWSQALSQLGMRIALDNNFEDVDVIWEFSQALLADKEANAKVFISAYERGAISRRTLSEELGKNYDVERLRKRLEKDDGDDELFVPIIMNPGGNQGIAPGDQPGRPSDSGNPDSIGPERDRENRTVK